MKPTIEQVKALILDQCGAEQAPYGFACAESIGYSDAEEFFSIAMARILYGEAEAMSGDRYPVEPGSLDICCDEPVEGPNNRKETDMPLFVTFSLNLEVHDRGALYKAAFARALANGVEESQAYDWLKPDCEIDVGECLRELLDPGSLPGCDIQDSTCEGFTAAGEQEV